MPGGTPGFLFLVTSLWNDKEVTLAKRGALCRAHQIEKVVRNTLKFPRKNQYFVPSVA
jgi:hypothetical protein